MVFALGTFRDWKKRASQALSSFGQDDEQNFADVMFHNMLRHNEEFRAFVPLFITKSKSNVGLSAERASSQDNLVDGSEDKETDDLGPGMDISLDSVLQRTEERPILKPKGLLGRLEGLERKVSKRFKGKSRAEEKQPQNECRGQKRTHGVFEGAGLGTESVKRMKMEHCLKTKAWYCKLHGQGNMGLTMRLTLAGSR